MAGLMEDKGRLLTTDEAAELLRLSPRTLEGMRDADRGPRYYRLSPGRRGKVVYKLADLESWLEQFAREPAR